jgi:hypothetical protein
VTEGDHLILEGTCGGRSKGELNSYIDLGVGTSGWNTKGSEPAGRSLFREK